MKSRQFNSDKEVKRQGMHFDDPRNLIYLRKPAPVNDGDDGPAPAAAILSPAVPDLPQPAEEAPADLNPQDDSAQEKAEEVNLDRLAPKLTWTPVVIPDGDYSAVVTEINVGNITHQAPKLFIWLKIITPGPAFEKKLFWAANFNPRRRMSPRSKYVQTWLRVAGSTPGGKFLSPKIFLNRVLLIHVEVNRSGYSVALDILAAETGQTA
jgi:hypothetical protein